MLIFTIFSFRSLMTARCFLRIDALFRIILKTNLAEDTIIIFQEKRTKKYSDLAIKADLWTNRAEVSGLKPPTQWDTMPKLPTLCTNIFRFIFAKTALAITACFTTQVPPAIWILALKSIIIISRISSLKQRITA